MGVERAEPAGPIGRAEAGMMPGRPLAAAIEAEVQRRAAALAARHRRPSLVAVLIGDDPASRAYLAVKARRAARVGIDSRVVALPAATPPRALAAQLARLNADPGVDAVLVQLPLPPPLSAAEVAAWVSPDKDVDALHPLSRGRLAAGLPTLAPCTPAGICRLLDHHGVDLRGLRAVVVGRSPIVGRPMAAMLLRRDATVVHCHRHTQRLAEEVARAELLITAVGQPGLVPGDWIRPGAVVVDVGLAATAEGLRGDVEPVGARARARLITPVPGGVGPLTVAMLLENTVTLAERWALAPAPGG